MLPRSSILMRLSMNCRMAFRRQLSPKLSRTTRNRCLHHPLFPARTSPNLNRCPNSLAQRLPNPSLMPAEAPVSNPWAGAATHCASSFLETTTTWNYRPILQRQQRRQCNCLPAQDEQPPDPPSPHSRASSVVMEDEVAPDPPTMQPSPPRPVEPESSAQTRNSTPSAQRPSELYDIKGHVGEGTFGKVYKAENLVTGGFVALKRIRMESEKEGFPVTAMREIKLLQSLRHENVVRLFEMMVSNGSVSMVFEYMEHDLTGILSQTQFAFTEAHLKSLCRQMLAGLAYLHHKGVIHRDIKGSNILVNNRGQLKLADFGLARFYQKRRRTDYTNRVITQWYRPPELLLGATVYGPEVDMWSAGCIMLELFTKKPVFQGNDEIHQLDTIYKIIGTPTVDRWPDMVNLPWYELVKPREDIPNRFRDMFKKWMSVPALDLAEQLLCYDPETRITATQALETPYFTQEAPAAEAPTGLATLSAEWHELDTKRAKKKKKD
ncbi:Pkinase-domain-containing protein [Mycena kentingensis (nom. inval.)]|nr:Pkinase-domain-containing protein [Mycena kentingensis (nom. inval.)]